MVILYIGVLLWIILIACTKTNTIINNKYINNIILSILIISVSISIYNIDVNEVTDLPNYAKKLSTFSGASFFDIDFNLTKEPLFFLLMWAIANTFDSIHVLLVLVWIIVSFNLIRSLKNLFNSNFILLVFFSYITYFIFFDYVLNVIRQGLAISFLLVSVSLLVTNKKRFSFYFNLLIAPFFHISSLPIALSLVLLKLFKPKLRTVSLIWLFSVLIMITGFNTSIFQWVQGSYFDTYTSDYAINRYGGSTNRIDFLVFGVFFAIIGYVLWKYFLNKDKEYLTLLKIYLVFNTYFLCLGFIAYSDRLASYSWMIIPLILWKAVPQTVNSRYKSIALILIFFITSILTGSISVVLWSL